jgi:hypothetical protein
MFVHILTDTCLWFINQKKLNLEQGATGRRPDKTTLNEGDQIKESEMDGECSTQERDEEKGAKFWLRNLTSETDHLEDLNAVRTETSLKRNSEGAYPLSSRVQSDTQRRDKDYLAS